MATPMPRYNAETNTCNAADSEIRVLNERDLNIEKDLFDARDCELRLDDGRGRGDFRQRLEDGDA
jgi:hypothetical protein